MKYRTFIKFPIDLNQKQIDDIFHAKLRDLCDGQWISGDKVMEEHTTSHRFDAIVGNASDPQFRLLRAITELKAALEEKCR